MGFCHYIYSYPFFTFSSSPEAICPLPLHTVYEHRCFIAACPWCDTSSLLLHCQQAYQGCLVCSKSQCGITVVVTLNLTPHPAKLTQIEERAGSIYSIYHLFALTWCIFAYLVPWTRWKKIKISQTRLCLGL